MLLMVYMAYEILESIEGVRIVLQVLYEVKVRTNSVWVFGHEQVHCYVCKHLLFVSSTMHEHLVVSAFELPLIERIEL